MQHHGHLPRQYIADHATGYPGHGAHDHGNQPWGAEIEGLLGTDHGKEGQSEGIRHRQHIPWHPAGQLDHPHTDQRRGNDHPDIEGVAYPEDRGCPQDHVADGATPDGGNRRQHHDTETIHPETAGHQYARKREYRSTKHVADVNNLLNQCLHGEQLTSNR